MAAGTKTTQLYSRPILAGQTVGGPRKTPSLSPRATHTRPAANGSPGKLYNPNTDPVRRPVMTAEPEAMSEGASGSQSPRAIPPRVHPTQPSRGVPEAHRQLFDPRKHDAVLFSTQHRQHNGPAPLNGSPNVGRPTPTPKSSGDWVSASSTSSTSYAQSEISSNLHSYLPLPIRHPLPPLSLTPQIQAVDQKTARPARTCSHGSYKRSTALSATLRVSFLAATTTENVQTIASEAPTDLAFS